MREFYVYGFKSRDGYGRKSARSYDDERRRIESWLGDHMAFTRTPEGKKYFISVDSRSVRHNPLYKAWKAKSFTDGDITLHFIIFDILHSPEIKMSLAEIVETADREYLSTFTDPMLVDESTVRKKLKEYCDEGLLVTEKQGKRLLYFRTPTSNISPLSKVLDFYSEAAPCGVIGSFILDKLPARSGVFSFKHHYITDAMDSEVLAVLFTAMRKKCSVTVTNRRKGGEDTKEHRVIPLRIMISVQSGRQYLLAYRPEYNSMSSYRLDYLSNVRPEEYTPRFDELRRFLDVNKKYMWGAVPPKNNRRLERVEFTVNIPKGEEYILRRLEREKRNGTVEKIDEHTYRYSADVCETSELIPWIRTFICRITDLKISNKEDEQRFKNDLLTMYEMYGIGGE